MAAQTNRESPVPAAVAWPAAAAALAYFNAKMSVSYDYTLYKAFFMAFGRVKLRERRGTLNLFHILEERAKNPATANKDLLIFEGRRYTYAETYETTLRYGHWMRATLGIKAKDRVAMNFQNSETFIFVWWALWSIGAKPAFMNYNLTGKSLSHCIKAAKTKLCIYDPSVAESITGEVTGDLPDVEFVEFSAKRRAEAESTPPARVPDSHLAEDSLSNMAILIYTSGTTGLPKPAVVSWAKALGGATIPEAMLGRGNDIMYTVRAGQSAPNARAIKCSNERDFSRCLCITHQLQF